MCPRILILIVIHVSELIHIMYAISLMRNGGASLIRY